MNNYPYQINSIEKYHEVYAKSVNQPEQFWEGIAQHFVWKKKWDKILEWDFKNFNVNWFKGGKLNITENCLDRHLKENAATPAIIW